MAKVRLTVLGSADAFSSRGRGNSCYLIEDARGALAVDFGPTAMKAMKDLGKEPLDLDGVLITHLHGDHFGGLHLLFIDALYRAWRRRGLVIAGPPGTRRHVSKWLALAWGKAGRRKTPFPVRFVEFRPGQTVSIAGRRVRVFRAHHQSPPDVSTALRVTTQGRTLSFTGDTQWTDELKPLSAGADVFLCECTGYGPAPKHLSWKELQPRLPELKARRILLTHLSEEARGRIRTHDRRVRLAEDGLVVAL